MNPTQNSQERQPDGRTVRDIALHSPALVNEVWCRKILRQVLQSLDAQYANGDPHRLIMLDTIVIRASGDAILLPDPDANADFQTEVASDLRALAAVIHYAITREMPATAPLTGRGLEGYSDSLLGAVDRCLSPNKTQRPQTVAELRDLLGMVSVGLLKQSAAVPAAPAAPVAAAAAAKTVDLGPPASPRKWLWIAIAAALLGGALYFVRQHGAEELVGAAVRVRQRLTPHRPLPQHLTRPRQTRQMQRRRQRQIQPFPSSLMLTVRPTRRLTVRPTRSLPPAPAPPPIA
jgi:hypothetical protein